MAARCLTASQISSIHHHQALLHHFNGSYKLSRFTNVWEQGGGIMGGDTGEPNLNQVVETFAKQLCHWHIGSFTINTVKDRSFGCLLKNPAQSQQPGTSSSCWFPAVVGWHPIPQPACGPSDTPKLSPRVFNKTGVRTAGRPFHSQILEASNKPCSVGAQSFWRTGYSLLLWRDGTTRISARISLHWDCCYDWPEMTGLEVACSPTTNWYKRGSWHKRFSKLLTNVPQFNGKITQVPLFLYIFYISYIYCIFNVLLFVPHVILLTVSVNVNTGRANQTNISLTICMVLRRVTDNFY